MKKIKIFVLCAIMALSSLVMFGCGNKQSENQFIEVMSLSYLYDLSATYTKNFHSTIFYNCDFENKESIDEMTFRNFDETHKFYSLEKDIDRNKSIIDIVSKDDFIVLASRNTPYDDYKYHKVRVTDIEMRYISVRIIDANSFYIKNYNGDISFVSCSNYEVEFFN